MDKRRALTIDHVASRAKLKEDGRKVAGYARWRGFAISSVTRILAGDYPPNDLPDSVFQRVLQSLQKDGYLVESGENYNAQSQAA